MKPAPKHAATLRGVYAITDDALLPGPRLLSQAEKALSTGISLLQYRSKNGDASRRLQQAQALATLCARYEVPLIINDDVQLAQQAGAAGVHVGTADASVTEARARLGPHAIIGASCHADLQLAIAAQQAGADYVAFGRFFPSRTKPEAPPAPLALLGEAKACLRIPIVAIGGIDGGNGAVLLQAGADMIAAVHAVFGSSGGNNSGDDGSDNDAAAGVRALNALFPVAESTSGCENDSGNNIVNSSSSSNNGSSNSSNSSNNRNNMSTAT